MQSFSERIAEACRNERYNPLPFLELYQEASTLVHPNHQIICEISKWLLPIFCRSRGKITSDFPRDQLNLKRKLALNQVKVTDAINPGVSKVKGKTMSKSNSIVELRQVWNWFSDTVQKNMSYLMEFPTHFAYFC